MIRTQKWLLTSALGMGMIGAGFAFAAGPQSKPATPGTSAPSTQPHEEKHPEIRKALMGLREAKNALEHAEHDFDGHRKDALEATDKAIAECEKCLTVDTNNKK